MIPVLIAPIQGHTDAPWRHFHHTLYGGDHLYFTPFIRIEHGDFRQHDLKDFTSPLSSDIRLVPQVIFRDMTELDTLISGLADRGAKSINLNMGCPFPLQMGKGRGAGFIPNVEEAGKLPGILEKYPDIDFSLKMRPGYENPDEWKRLLPVLNSIPFSFIAIHPRVGRQQYGGDLLLNEYGEFLEMNNNPVIFNGELKTPEDIDNILKQFPQTAGVMLGRGLLARPSLASEWESGKELDREARIEKMLDFHRKLLIHYSESLCGDTQILSKIKPFWEYAEPEIGRKAWKAIKKATNLPKYRSAVAMI